MMSLSAESPILRWNSNTAASVNRPSQTLPKYDDAKRERGVPVQYLPMLPEPAIPLPHDHESRLVSQSPDRIADIPHGAKAIAPDQQAAPPYRDARLLLSLKASVSPESLRPVTSSVREDPTSSVQEDDPAWGPHTYPRIVRPRRSSVSTPRTTTSTQNSANVAVPPPSSFSRIKYRYADPHTHKLMGEVHQEEHTPLHPSPQAPTMTHPDIRFQARLCCRLTRLEIQADRKARKMTMTARHRSPIPAHQAQFPHIDCR